MKIELQNIKPTYMSEEEISSSDVYLRENVIFESGTKYLIKANSGNGKTSVLNFIYGSNINFNGKILYNSESVNTSKILQFRISEISYVFQDLKLFPDLTAFENIQLKNKLTNHKSIDEIDFLIDKFQLSHKKNALVKNLSLGQKQRIAIIRAICQPFQFLLLDEPFSHIDNKNIGLATEIINNELATQNAGLIMTSLENNSVFNFDKVLNL